jgi:hypothetical protein
VWNSIPETVWLRSKTDGSRVTGTIVESAFGRSPITADYYIAALSVEAMSARMTDELKSAVPSLANLGKLKTRWMNGSSSILRRIYRW